MVQTSVAIVEVNWHNNYVNQMNKNKLIGCPMGGLSLTKGMKYEYLRYTQ